MIQCHLCGTPVDSEKDKEKHLVDAHPWYNPDERS